MSVDKSNRMRQKKDDFLTIGMMVLDIGTGTRTSSTCDLNFYAQFPICKESINFFQTLDIFKGNFFTSCYLLSMMFFQI